MPADIKIPIDSTPSLMAMEEDAAVIENSKKTLEAVGNSAEYNPKSVQLYNSIHEYADARYSKREIAKIIHCGQNTITRFLNNDYEPYAAEISEAFHWPD